MIIRDNTVIVVNTTTNETISVRNLTETAGNATINETLPTNTGNATATTNETLPTNTGNAITLPTNTGNATTNETLTAKFKALQGK
jgi:hypothetical protein